MVEWVLKPKNFITFGLLIILAGGVVAQGISNAHTAYRNVGGTPTPVPPTATPAPVTLLLNPIVSGDDGYEDFDVPTINIVGTSNIIGSSSTDNNRNATGIRFQNVTIPQGQVIDSATLRMKSGTSGHHEMNSTVQGYDADDHPGILTQVIGLTKTTASVEWDVVGSIGSNTEFTSPDLTTIIQEIVNRPGWVSGNSIVLTITGEATTPFVNMFAWSYDHGVRADDPLLTINYTP